MNTNKRGPDGSELSDGLGPLPEPYCNAHEDAGSYWPDTYSAYQMREYAAQAVAAERERLAAAWHAAHGYDRNGVADWIRRA